MGPLLIAGLLFLASSCLWAQNVPTQSASQAQPQTTNAVSREPRIERIRIEDKGAVIDELREGGLTQSIEVKPKGGLPAYQVAPGNGQRTWKVLGF